MQAFNVCGETLLVTRRSFIFICYSARERKTAVDILLTQKQMDVHTQGTNYSVSQGLTLRTNYSLFKSLFTSSAAALYQPKPAKSLTPL